MGATARDSARDSAQLATAHGVAHTMSMNEYEIAALNSTRYTDDQMKTVVLRNWERVVRIVRDELTRELSDDVVGAADIERARDALSELVESYS